MNTPNNTENGRRNPNISKWNILFEKEGKQFITVRPDEGTQVYTCYACRELFGAKSSFLDHVNRYTIVLTFTCQLCPDMAELKFFNPCALLLHSRQHYTPFGGVILLDDIIVTSLPLGLIGFPSSRDIPLLYNVLDDTVDNINLDTRFYSPARANKGKNIINMAPTILLFYSYKLNGTPPLSLILKQISSNVPRCIFTKVESTTVNTNTITPLNEKTLTHLLQTAQENFNKNQLQSNQLHQINLGNREDNNNQLHQINLGNREDNNNQLQKICYENRKKVTNQEVLEVNRRNPIDINLKNHESNFENLRNDHNLERITEKLDNQLLKNSQLQKSSHENKKTPKQVIKIDSQLQKTQRESIKLDIQLQKNSYCDENAKLPTENEFPNIKEEVNEELDPLLMDEYVDNIENDMPLNITLTESTDDKSCPECQIPIPYNKLMSEHFQNSDPLNDANQCEICMYVAASRCSLTAHKRLHERGLPFICPECGREFETNMSLLDHIEDVCFHLAKQVRFRCPKKNCCKVFAQLSTFITHFEIHIQTLNKCSICNATFYGLRDHLEHVEMDHPNETVVNEILYKCTICRHSTLLKEHYHMHIKWHCTNKTLRVYVYVCKFCRNFFRSSATYANHLLRCNKKDLTVEELKRLKKCNAAVVCLHCNYIIRLASHFNDCPRCGCITNAIRSSNTRKHLEDRTIKCILCYEDLIVSEATKHDCKYKNPAVLLIREDETIEKIANVKQETPNPENTSNILTKLDFNLKKKRRKSISSPRFTKQKRTNNNIDYQLDEPIPFDGVYTCKICVFKIDDRKVFHEHIREHRDVSTSYQCMECGECFVVKPSFHKHMQYYHQIQNVDEYVKENECVDENAISELKKCMRIESGEMVNEDVQENQCKVCLRQFDDPLELNKHFRVHGMAFLKTSK